jgi:hypothetical protein
LRSILLVLLVPSPAQLSAPRIIPAPLKTGDRVEAMIDEAMSPGVDTALLSEGGEKGGISKGGISVSCGCDNDRGGGGDGSR